MPKKAISTDRRRSAFSLLELLVVMSIMIILAGLVLAAMGGMRDQAMRKKASVQIESIGLALEDFKIDNGEYPISEFDPESSRDSAIEGASRIYQALSGDGDDLLRDSGGSPSEGKLGSTGTPYMDQLDPQADSQGMVTEEGGKFFLNDPWREPYRYLRYKLPDERKINQRRPATYDLYSHGEAEEDHDDDADDKNEKKWITNWD